jgi:hypothetical protein|tara:strand:- start:18 stop:1217 length:1200 start_codon:yes stop_codon:yes gene_type:complete
MGSFCTPSYTELPSSSETVAGTEIPAWVAAAGRTTFERAAELANSPYPQYQGARTASYGGDRRTEEERMGADILRSGAESYMPYMNRAGEVADTLGGGYDAMSQEQLLGDPFQGASREDLLGSYSGASRQDLIGQGVSPFSMENAQPYMDIYQDSMNPAIREIEEQTMRAQNEARARAATGGGGFGSRLGIMEATTAGEGAQAAGDLRAQAAREGLGFAAGRYDQDVAQSERDRAARFNAENAMRGQFEQDRSARFGADAALRGQYDTDRQARFGADDAARNAYETNEASRIQQMSAYQGMAPLVQDLQTQAAAGLITSGEARRQLDQQALDLAYADYLDQKMYPQEMLNFTLGALSGTPYNTINRSYTQGSQMSANPSLYGQALAGMGGLYSAYKMSQ